MSNSGIFRRAALAAGIMMAWQVAAKTARDSLFLSAFPARALPAMVAGGSIFSILLATLSARLLRRYGPFKLIPAGYLLSAVLHIVEWLLLGEYPKSISVIVYLHVVAFGSVLLSGFWALANEQFDPREARRNFGRITGFGTVGGMAGGLMAGWVATLGSNATLLPLLAFFQMGCWAALLQFSPPRTRLRPAAAPRFAETLKKAPYLYSLASLILLVSMSAAMLDYLFKAQAVGHFGRGAGLSRFFATYYVASSVASFAAQAGLSRMWLDRFGLGRTVATLPVGVAGSSLLALLAPSVWLVTFARAMEQLLRGSLFRSGYELFYTPMAQAEKRTAKSVIDIGADRLGDGLGAGIVQVLIALPASASAHAILALTVAMAAFAGWLSFRLDRSYQKVLEKNLVEHEVHLRAAEVEDMTTRSVVMRAGSGATPATLRPVITFASAGTAGAVIASPSLASAPPPSPKPAEPEIDTAMQQLAELRSGDNKRIRKALREIGLLDTLTTPQVIQLLGNDTVYREAHGALTRCVFRIAGQLVDSLLDESQNDTVRSRIPRLLALCDSRVAWAGLFQSLGDQRFEIRYRCGRALDTMLQRHPEYRPLPNDVYAVVSKELAVSRRVFEERRVGAKTGEVDAQKEEVDKVLEERASQSLSHVFTLLGLVLPRDAVQTAFRAIHTDDDRLKALALEFLESSLPRELREALSSHIEAPQGPAKKKAAAPSENSLQNLLESSPSIVARLEEMGFRGTGEAKG
ncbi:MAG TPA: hypothetical protein VGF59_03265 [Bryobacteraceae bacterium]